MISTVSKMMPAFLYIILKRIQGFLMLPKIFVQAAGDKECQKSNTAIIMDLLYIYFRLKYFPKDYLKCRLWENNHQELVYFYGSPSNLYARLKFRKNVQNREYQIVFDDKYVTYHYLKGLNIPQPQTFGLLQARDYHRSEIMDLFSSIGQDEIIVKPVEAKHGRGVHLIHRRNGEIYLRNSTPETKLEKLSLKDVSLIQEKVNQHPDIAGIYPHSVNTIRIHTLYTKDSEVIFFATGMRFGRNGNVVDNVGAGGIAVGIDWHTGKTGPAGFDGPAKKYAVHPDTQANFCHFRIPYWEEMVEIAKKIQQATFFYKFLGLDFAVSGNGPMILEINANPEIGYQEMYTIPLLKDERIRKEFARYDLLYNRLQKKLVSHLILLYGTLNPLLEFFNFV